jgi:hypothetical protein
VKEIQVNRCSKNDKAGGAVNRCCATCRHWATWSREVVRRCLLKQSFLRGDYENCTEYEAIDK